MYISQAGYKNIFFLCMRLVKHMELVYCQIEHPLSVKKIWGESIMFNLSRIPTSTVTEPEDRTTTTLKPFQPGLGKGRIFPDSSKLAMRIHATFIIDVLQVK